MSLEPLLQKLGHLHRQCQTNPGILFKGVIADLTPDWVYLKGLLQDACLRGTDTHQVMPTIFSTWSESVIFCEKQSAARNMMFGRSAFMTVACTLGAILSGKQNMEAEILVIGSCLLMGSYLANLVCFSLLPKSWFWIGQEFTETGKYILIRLLRPPSPAGVSAQELASIEAVILAQRSELVSKEKRLAMIMPIFELLTLGGPPMCFGALLGMSALLDGH